MLTAQVHSLAIIRVTWHTYVHFMDSWIVYKVYFSLKVVDPPAKSKRDLLKLHVSGCVLNLWHLVSPPRRKALPCLWLHLFKLRTRKNITLLVRTLKGSAYDFEMYLPCCPNFAFSWRCCYLNPHRLLSPLHQAQSRLWLLQSLDTFHLDWTWRWCGVNLCNEMGNIDRILKQRDKASYSEL